MHARMTHALTTRYRARRRHACPHRRCKGSALVTYFGFFGCTSRGQLHLMVVQAAVQWRAARQRMSACVDRERSLDRPLVARAKPTRYEWLCPRLSGASGAQSGRSPASQARRASTVAVAVAAGHSAAIFIRILRSRQKVSFFGLSGAATHPLKSVA